MAAYPYEPLDPDRHEFRLLQIKDFNFPTVECVIRHVTLDSTPDYTALSYVWGNNPNSESIIINGHSVNINQDLERTLLTLRDFQRRTRPNIGLW